jgi:predicted dehydrogenase
MTTQAPTGPVTVVAIGAGTRTSAYSSYSKRYPDKMKVVAVAEPVAHKREAFAKEYNIPPSLQFASYEQVAAQPGIAEAAINGTMDRMHHPSGMALLSAGYHMLLEKPIAPTEREVLELVNNAAANKRLVLIGHVLRYTRFYQTIKSIIDSGRIGTITGIHTQENVGYLLMPAAFVRGQWNKESTSGPMLLSKCCHDMDVLIWLLNGVKPVRVSSFGSLRFFVRENAPEGSTDRCLNGCKIEATCDYSAKLHHITKGFGQAWAFGHVSSYPNVTLEEKILALKTTSPHGRCVWRSDNDVVDRQTVMIEFADGVTVTHDMFCTNSRDGRTAHIIGTKGEIEADGHSGIIKIRKPAHREGMKTVNRFDEESIDVAAQLASETYGHGGGDDGLAGDFVALLRGKQGSSGLTRIQDSVEGHRLTFAAEVARKEHRVVELL